MGFVYLTTNVVAKSGKVLGKTSVLGDGFDVSADANLDYFRVDDIVADLTRCEGEAQQSD